MSGPGGEVRDLTHGSWLVDILGSPRADFSRRPGQVLKADDHPTPPEIAALPPLTSAD